ncbi:hypothetical protein RN001_001872 [Aquatica leii]|uniref:THAP-type domain-containing protein n=1 Tax=Aquatica leii TaxID=1421715 RepID=A0AAN7SCY4_9COLE|nr:hypothetical protein RN001_001872 [Aquatica leii]
MGHTSKTHDTFYKLPQDIYQVAKVSKILQLIEKGNIAQFKNKCLEEIDIDMESVEEDQDIDENTLATCQNEPEDNINESNRSDPISNNVADNIISEIIDNITLTKVSDNGKLQINKNHEQNHEEVKIRFNFFEMVMCWAPDCKHYNQRETCKFFIFPKDEKLRNKWKQLVRRDVDPGPGAYFCWCHFPEEKRKNLFVFFNHNIKKRFNFQSPEKRKRRTKETDVSVSICIKLLKFYLSVCQNGIKQNIGIKMT